MRIRLSILLFTICSFVSAQTQQGVVKTRGRMVNGQVIAGTRLNGATITLNIGNPLVSGNNGAFSFNVPSDKNYSLVSARKQGYTLADPEYTRRSFRYSASNPFYVVLEDENQRQADINAATRKVRKTLQTQLDKREKEIEELKAQNKLTETDYQKRLQQLYDNQSKSEQLVKEMAERYASTDYDQLDEFNRQVQMYIEEGELQKADSMIRSKGDMGQRVIEYHNIVAANKKERELLEQREQNLEQSENGAAKAYEDIAQDLHRRHDIFIQEFKRDSALYCLKLIADMDTTNINAVWEYALECYNNDIRINDSEKYFQICLRISTHQNDSCDIIRLHFILAGVYEKLGDYEKCEILNKYALEESERLLNDGDDYYRGVMLYAQFNFGNLYADIGDYDKSEEFFKLALKNCEQLYLQFPDSTEFDLAMIQVNFAYSYAGAKKYSEAIEMINKAIALMPTEANFYDSKGEILLMQGKNEEALEMWKKVIEINPVFLKDYPDGTNLSNGLKKLGLIE